MKKILSYISKNKVFICLLSVIIAITLGLGYYYVTNVREPKAIDKVPGKTVTDVNKKTAIDSYQGAYDTKSKQISLSWTIVQYDQKVTSIKLYNKDSILADVSNLNSYVLNQGLYQFPGGNNEFVIKVTLDNGEVLEKSTTVNIDYFSSIECKTEISELDVLVKLTYEYNASVSIDIPRIVANSLPYNYEFKYKETMKETLENGYVKETTIYEIDTTQAKTTEKVTIRWIFDSIGMSYDFPITLTQKINTQKEE